MRIKEVKARKIFNSNGKEEIEIEARMEDGLIGRGSSDSGTSTGKHEINPYPKEGIDYLVEVFNKKIGNQLINLNIERFEDLQRVEESFRIFDITGELKNVGGNIIIATEYAVLKAISENNVYEFLNPKAKKIPGILANVIGGGKHTFGKGSDFQEFLIIPRTRNINNSVELCVNFYNEIIKEISKRDKTFVPNRNIEGALCPDLMNIEILNMLRKLCDKYTKEHRVGIELGVDVAGNSLWNGRRYEYKKFTKFRSKRNLSRDEQIDFIRKMIKSYELKYAEDPLEEEDFEGYREINKGTNAVCGDDLTTTNLERLKEACKKISYAIIKPNQIGSLIKTKEAVDFAFRNDITPIMSHRSGATDDLTLMHLAVGWNIPLIKMGLMNGERINRLNELIRIKETI